jgi:hypothetical protein
MTDFFKVLIGNDNIEVIEFYKGQLSRRPLTNEEKMSINLNNTYPTEVTQIALDDFSVRVSSDPTNFYRLVSVNIDGFDYEFSEVDGRPAMIPIKLLRNFGNPHIFEYIKYPINVI